MDIDMGMDMGTNMDIDLGMNMGTSMDIDIGMDMNLDIDNYSLGLFLLVTIAF